MPPAAGYGDRVMSCKYFVNTFQLFSLNHYIVDYTVFINCTVNTSRPLGDKKIRSVNSQRGHRDSNKKLIGLRNFTDINYTGSEL